MYAEYARGPQCNVGIIEGPFASRSAAAGDIAASLGLTWQSGQACSGRTDSAPAFERNGNAHSSGPASLTSAP